MQRATIPNFVSKTSKTVDDRPPAYSEDYNLMVRDIYNVPLYIKWQLLLRIPWTLKQKQIWGWYCQITVYKLSWLLK